jgi:hypothetical protein
MTSNSQCAVCGDTKEEFSNGQTACSFCRGKDDDFRPDRGDMSRRFRPGYGALNAKSGEREH